MVLWEYVLCSQLARLVLFTHQVHDLGSQSPWCGIPRSRCQWLQVCANLRPSIDLHGWGVLVLLSALASHAFDLKLGVLIHAGGEG